MLIKFCFAIFIFLFQISAFAKTHSLKENISVQIVASGDLQGAYEFTGPLGELISAISSDEKMCQISSLFRKVNHRGIDSIEAWLSIICTIEGQKTSYKTHRIYLQLNPSVQRIKLPMLAKNLKNVQLEFSELYLKSSK